MAEPSASHNQDGAVPMAILVSPDSGSDLEVEVLDVCMGVVIDSPSHADMDPPPDPPLSHTGALTWEQVPPCKKPVRRAGTPNATCRWGELSCPWRHHALWRQRQGRTVVTLQPCPLHPRSLILLCRDCPPHSAGPTQ